MKFVEINQLCYKKVDEISKTSDIRNFNFLITISKVGKLMKSFLRNQIKIKKRNRN